ncbi:MAG: class I SAM-dependent methyltransferase [Bryobacterales bacterium]|nr:class I SAM-dependent methyltransferase [Bryobacterales bacterium]
MAVPPRERAPEPVLESAPAPEPEPVRPAAPESSSQENCPACGTVEMRTVLHGSDRLYHTTDKDFLVVQCAKCGLMRLYPWPSPAEIGRYYPDDYWFTPEQDPSGKWAERYRRFVLSDHVRFVWRAFQDSRENGPVLDVGCGGGLLLRMMAERGARVIGLDFALAAAVRANEVNGVPAVCGSLGSRPLREGSCAVVTMFHVLEHLYDPAGYLDEAHRILKPNGRLVIQVPNASCWQFLLFGEHWNGVDIPRHLLHFRESDIRALLEDCGFEIVRAKHFSWRDNPAGLATTLAPSLDPMARRICGVHETPRMKVWKDLVYFGLVLASLPFTMAEALCRQGSTIMLEARKRP